MACATSMSFEPLELELGKAAGPRSRASILVSHHPSIGQRGPGEGRGRPKRRPDTPAVRPASGDPALGDGSRGDWVAGWPWSRVSCCPARSQHAARRHLKTPPPGARDQAAAAEQGASSAIV